MKYIKTVVAALAFSLFAAGQAHATVIEDFVGAGAEYDQYDFGWINFSHSFDTSLGTAIAATLEVSVYDIDDTTYMYVEDPVAATWNSIGTLAIANGEWRTSTFTIPAASLALLNTAGSLNFRFNDRQSSSWGTELDWSKLTTTVPEPATALLMGLGLVGFGFARRRGGKV